MKNWVYILAFAIGLGACMSPKKMLDKGYYDGAIAKSVKKIKKNPTKTKHVMVLKDAYRLANQLDNDRIAFLRKEGRPDVWDEIFAVYSNMKRRQDMVRPLPANVLTQIHYVYVDYDQEIISAKRKAAEYFYAHAVKLLEENDKMAARKAYDELVRLKRLYPNYKDVEQLLQEAHYKGTNFVIFEMKNATRVPLPPDFESELVKLSLSELNNKWTAFENKKIKGRNYDYAILVNMKRIDVSPEHVKEVDREEKKEVEDGFDYALDANGNVMKDTAGNDIKIARYKEIVCYITEYQMHKQAIISGSIDFIDLRSGQLVKSEPITSEFIFDHIWVNVKGDKRALSPKTRKMIKNKPMPFPDDFSLLLNTGQVMKNMTKEIIWRHKNLFYY